MEVGGLEGWRLMEQGVHSPQSPTSQSTGAAARASAASACSEESSGAPAGAAAFAGVLRAAPRGNCDGASDCWWSAESSGLGRTRERTSTFMLTWLQVALSGARWVGALVGTCRPAAFACFFLRDLASHRDETAETDFRTLQHDSPLLFSYCHQSLFGLFCGKLRP